MNWIKNLVNNEKVELKIPILYFFLGASWILFSDKLLESFVKSNYLLTELQTVKGWIFVAVTSGIIYILINRSVRKFKETEGKLVTAKEQALEADKLKTEFLAQMSHEIRSPISVILNYISLLKEELKDSSNEDIHYSFTAIDNSAERIIRTIDLILNMSELQTGRFETFPRQIHLQQDILLPIIREMEKKAKAKSLELNFRSFTKNPLLTADIYTVTQIFTNLVENAIKYTNNGWIMVEVYDSGDEVLNVDVTDTGIGISEEFLDNLFKPFMQEEMGYTRSFDGNGLGLSLVKKYCELNNAVITVATKKGYGTKFTVRFSRK